MVRLCFSCPFPPFPFSDSSPPGSTLFFFLPSVGFLILVVETLLLGFLRSLFPNLLFIRCHRSRLRLDFQNLFSFFFFFSVLELLECDHDLAPFFSPSVPPCRLLDRLHPHSFHRKKSRTVWRRRFSLTTRSPAISVFLPFRQSFFPFVLTFS